MLQPLKSSLLVLLLVDFPQELARKVECKACFYFRMRFLCVEKLIKYRYTAALFYLFITLTCFEHFLLCICSACLF